ncbi:hypothetical protein PG996_007958 [Apiospora saccharicola]|uniref:Rhodopsin domain-containing protein n=1 Tax=Apiospora saccharicola TaxID=335842 RepID=A0ABR1UZ25_9PEZI
MAEQHYYQTTGHAVAAGIALSLLDIGAVACRFQARSLSKQPLKIDDWLLLPATLLTIGVGVCLVYGAYNEAFGLEWTISILLPISMACTKLSFLFFYRRIFHINRDLKWFLWGLAGFVVAWAIAFVIATLLCCGTMLFAIWKPISEMAMCMFFLDVLMAFCITGFVTDLVIIAIPMPIVWRLKLSTTNKLVASCSFLVGAVTLAASLARLIVSVGFVKEAADPKRDFILNTTLYCYWGMVECSIGVFAACLPTLQIFFRRNTWQSVADKTKSLFSSGSRSSRNSKNRFDSESSQDIQLKHRDQRDSNDKKKPVMDSRRGSSESTVELQAPS